MKRNMRIIVNWVMVQRSIGVKKRKQDVIAFVNTSRQFIYRASYVQIVT